MPGPRQAPVSPVPGPGDEEALRAASSTAVSSPAGLSSAPGTRSTTSGSAPPSCTARGYRGTSCAAASASTAGAATGWGSSPAPGSSSSSSPASCATGSSTARPRSSSGGWTRGLRARNRPARPEGLVLPARSLPHAPDAPALAATASSTRRATRLRGKRKVTLGTSVGWSDVYPPTYPEQWIDVTGLRGCFAYRHVADPGNGIFESNERNNSSAVTVRLPYRSGAQRCPGRRSVTRQPGGGWRLWRTVTDECQTLVVAEKPSVARDLAAALPGSFKRSKDKTSLEGDDYVITWAVGHLVGLADPDAYDPKLKKWRYADLPIIPEKFKLVPNDDRAKKQLSAIHKLMARRRRRRRDQRLRRRPRGRADLRVRLRDRQEEEAGPAAVALVDDQQGDRGAPSARCAPARRWSRSRPRRARAPRPTGSWA